MDIRLAIYNNIKGHNEKQFTDIINDAMSAGEEKTLPGLGVFFEMFWKQADDKLRNDVLKLLKTASS